MQQLARGSRAGGAPRPPRRPRCAAPRASAAASVSAPPRPPAVAPPPPLATLPPGVSASQLFAPPVADDPASMLAAGVPFLTKDAGSLPAVPRSLDHALYMYGE
jgi:hypothetical protein